MFEQDYKSKCLVIYVVLYEQERVDNALMNLKLVDRTHFKYMSFKESTKNIRLCALHVNELNNVETRFESLYNAKVFDIVSYKGKSGVLQDMLLSIKISKVNLFVGVKQ